MTDAGGPLAGIWVVAINPAGAVVANVTTAGGDGLHPRRPRRRVLPDPLRRPHWRPPPLYYNGTAGFGDATPVAVTGGTTTPGIDATLTTPG